MSDSNNSYVNILRHQFSSKTSTSKPGGKAGDETAANIHQQSCDTTSFFYLLACTLSHQLMALQDDELYGGEKSINPAAGDIILLVEILKDAIYHLTWTLPILLLPYITSNKLQTPLSYSSNSMLNDRLQRAAFLQCCCRLYNQLSIRNERRGHHLGINSSLESIDSSVSGRAAYLAPSEWTWSKDRHYGAVGADLNHTRTDISVNSTGNVLRLA